MSSKGRKSCHMRWAPEASARPHMKHLSQLSTGTEYTRFLQINKFAPTTLPSSTSSRLITLGNSRSGSQRSIRVMEKTSCVNQHLLTSYQMTFVNKPQLLSSKLTNRASITKLTSDKTLREQNLVILKFQLPIQKTHHPLSKVQQHQWTVNMCQYARLEALNLIKILICSTSTWNSSLKTLSLL